MRLRLEILARDFRYGLRRLMQAPAFAVVASVSLAIGIGTNTAAFGVLNAVLLRSLPVEDPASLAVVKKQNAGTEYSTPHPVFVYLRDHTSSVRVVSFRDVPVNVSAGATTERLTGMLVSGNYFGVLGVRMTLGSAIGDDDDRVPRSGGARGMVAVLSHRYWIRQFHGDTGIVGRSIRVHGRPVVVAGVAAPGFNGTRTGSIPGVYLPMMFAPNIFDDPTSLTNPRNNWLRLMARVKPGYTLAEAEAEMNGRFRQFNLEVVLPLATTDVARNRARSATIVLEPGRAGLFELGTELRTSLLILMGLVGLVFLIACVNVANLMVGRAERQHRDTAIALALGASTSRLWSQHLAESLIIGALGVLLGLLSAVWIRDLLLPLVPASHELDVSMDPRVFGLSVLLGLSIAFALGTIAVWRAGRLGVTRALKGEDLSARLWLRKGLIVGQLALSVVVLVMAALFARTLDMLQGVDPGFERARVLVASIAPGAIARERQSVFFNRLIEDVQRIPGVVSAAFSNHEPLAITTFWNMQLTPHGESTPQTVAVQVENVTPGYFATMGIPLLRGRDVEARDSAANAPPVVIVNETIAKRFLAGDPIGTQITGNGTMTFEVIGVVRDTMADGLREAGIPVLYRPGGSRVLVVRAAVPPETLATAVQAAARQLEPDVPVFNVRTIGDQIGRFLDRERTFANLSSAFGGLALLLSAVGLYGVIANSVSRRTREMGIRLALGAGSQRITRLILTEAGVLVAAGIVIGVPCAYAMGRVIASSLYGVEPGDPWSLGLSAAVLLAVAAIAASVPARRAARVDPVAALARE